ncbi:MAG TPA: 1-(5-phosphoribosyl)-5-[(5-phosphoribosylamino)methylideneamino]imidazole-4-carboxamide isomerase [Solirubrobacteraceae bacterium]|jgi:phosphoribosylformimino-5-aminoimidazole carboxamide ribotide isomerase|nr:1-(5-phosphoribosyl)-5-[(5-phosphoribosylamino)methylideneamino]imidazole-4-carboxamide isomerase [Solirubrobacteraceae bacterium]
MNLYPAIDILEGNAVRLMKGDFEARKVYDEDPLAAARGWTEEGAQYLHVVDLDGAKSGAPVNLDHLHRIAGELGVPVQYGGGLRSAAAVSDALAAGATRVILGTAAFTQPGLLEQVLSEHGPERVLVSVDVRDGHVTTAGWTETTEITTAAVIDSLARRGARQLVFTNVDRDGMLQGPDLEEVRRVARAARDGSVIYSGGIGQLADLQGLAGLGEESLEGVIVGKALYERRFTVAQARETLTG